MIGDLPHVVVRVAGSGDVGAITALRALWDPADGEDPQLGERIEDWIAGEGARRTIWLATLDGAPVGLASLLEYRRMPRPNRPDSRWGYVANMFVREEHRRRGVGSALLAAIIAFADERCYARLVLSPSEQSLPFYMRAGFVVPGKDAAGDRLLVRRGPARIAPPDRAP